MLLLTFYLLQENGEICFQDAYSEKVIVSVCELEKSMGTVDALWTIYLRSFNLFTFFVMTMKNAYARDEGKPLE